MSTQLSTEEVVSLISKKTGKSKEEIYKLVKETQEKLNNFVNEQGAAYLLANNLEVPLNTDSSGGSKELLIEDLTPGMGPVSLIGRISKIYRTRHFTRKDNTAGKFRKIELIDKSGGIVLTLWDKAVDLVEELGLSVGQLVRVSNVDPRLGRNETVEISMTSGSIIDPNVIGINEDEFPEVTLPPIIPINEIDPEKFQDTSVKGLIKFNNGINTFQRADGSSGKVGSILLIDKSGSIRITFWNEKSLLLEKFEVGSVFEFYNLQVKKDKNNELGLTFADYSSFEIVEDEELSKLNQRIDSKTILKISDITEELIDTGINLSANIANIGETKTIEGKGGEYKLTQLYLMDDTGVLPLNIWNEEIEKFENAKVNTNITLENLLVRYNNYQQQLELTFTRNSKVSIGEINSTEVENLPYKLFQEIKEKTPAGFFKVKITQKNELKSITRKTDMSEGKVLNLNVIDENGERGQLAAWDDDIKLIETLEVGDTIRLSFVRAKRNEYGLSLTIGRNSRVEKITDFDDTNVLFKTADELINSNFYEKTAIIHIKDENLNVEVEGSISSLTSKLFFYDSCLSCNRKIVIEDGIGVCPEHGEQSESKKVMILTITLDDHEDTIRAKFFGEIAEKLLGLSGKEAYEIIERTGDETTPIEQQKDKLLQRKIWIKGVSRLDNYSNELTISVNQFGWIDPKEKSTDILNRFI